MIDFRPAQSPAEREVAAIPCNCWLDDVPPYRSPCVFDDPRVEVNNCRYATMIQSANKKKTDCKHYHAALAQLEPEGPTDEELLRLAASAIDPYESCGIAPGEYEAETETVVEAYGTELIAFARAVLDRWGRPTTPLQPVPVSERLPGPEDCDAEGRCWWFCFECPGENSYWILAKEVYCNPTFWRPFSALPLPSREVQS